MQLKINVLCIIGSIVGICSFFIPWIYAWGWISPSGDNLFVISSDTHYSIDWRLSALIFIIGSIIALLSPIGGFIQFTGVGMMIGLLATVTYPHGTMDSGIIIGLISALFVTISFFKPIGIGFNNTSLRLRDRLVAFVKIEGQEQS